MPQKTILPFHIFRKALKRFLKVIYGTQQLRVRENLVGFEKALGAVKVIIYQIQYKSQSLINLARDYFRSNKTGKPWSTLKKCKAVLVATSNTSIPTFLKR